MRIESLEDRSLLSVSLSGMAWQDLDANGARTTSEHGAAGVVVEMFRSTDGTIGNADDVSCGVAVTDSAGRYTLTAATSGNYYLAFRLPAGLGFAPQNQGSNDGLDSDPNSVGLTAMLALADSVTRTDVDAGVIGEVASGFSSRFTSSYELVYGWAVKTDSTGNVYFTGRYDGTIDMDMGPGAYNLPGNLTGTTSGFIAKYTDGGALLWAKKVGTQVLFDKGLAIAPDGGVVAVGCFSDSGDFDPGPGTCILTAGADGNGPDAFVLKLDSAGNFVWARNSGCAGDGFGTGVTVGIDGSVYACGYFFGDGPGPFNLPHTGFTGFDIFVVKYDVSGAFLWARSAGGPAEDYAQAIAVVPGGGVAITGSFAQTVDFDPGPGTCNLTSTSGMDCLVWELDASGNFVWARNMGGTQFGISNDLVVASDGSIYTTGQFGGTFDFDPGPATFSLTACDSSDMFVAKLDPAGNFVWARAMGGSGIDGGYAIAVSPDGSVHAIGFFEGTADFDPGTYAFNLVSSGLADAVISRLDSSGAFVSAQQIGAQGNEAGMGLAFAPDGSLFTVVSCGPTDSGTPGRTVYELLLSKTSGSAPAPVLDPVVCIPAGRGDNRLSLRRHGDNIELVNTTTGTRLSVWSLGSLHSITIVGAARKADLLTVDFNYGGSFLIPGGIVFHGGKGGKDVLSVVATAGADLVEFRAGGIVAVNGMAITIDGVERTEIDGRLGNDTYRLTLSSTPVVLRDSAGSDTLDFSGAAKRVSLNLASSTGRSQRIAAWGETLALVGIFENVNGSPFADSISGNAAANILRGGNGNDELHGGAGNDLILGEAGDDRLCGDRGSNILIGGLGRDSLRGTQGDGLLIGGRTIYDVDLTALQSILAEWSRPIPLNSRVTNLSNGGGLNNFRVLQQGVSVLDDGARDILFAHRRHKWTFLFAEDRER